MLAMASGELSLHMLHLGLGYVSVVYGYEGAAFDLPG